MIDEDRDRRGNSLENEINDMFRRIGFNTEVRSKKFEFQGIPEADVIATRGDFMILIQAKRYDESQIDIDKLIDEWKNKGEKVGADRVLIIITGHKNIKEDYIRKAKQKGVYLWNENYWRHLQSLDSINLSLEVGKTLKIEEVLDYITKKEKNELKEVKEQIKEIKNSRIKDEIYAELEKIDFSEDTKRDIQLRKIENKIILYKEKEIENEVKDKTEDIELEEIFRKINDAKLDNHKKYAVLDKISKKINLSTKSKSIIDWEEIGTWIKKLQEEADTENWGDDKYISIEKLMTEGKLSEKDKEQIQEKIKGLGLSKKGYTEAEKIKIDDIIKRAIFKKKLYKLLIRVGILVIIAFILWRILF